MRLCRINRRSTGKGVVAVCGNCASSSMTTPRLERTSSGSGSSLRQDTGNAGVTSRKPLPCKGEAPSGQAEAAAAPGGRQLHRRRLAQVARGITSALRPRWPGSLAERLSSHRAEDSAADVLLEAVCADERGPLGPGGDVVAERRHPRETAVVVL